MKQKTIWTRYLIIGLISFLLCLNYSCADVEYVLKCDFKFVNETEYKIHYSRIYNNTQDTSFLFTIPSNSSYLLELEGESEKNPPKENAGEGLLWVFNNGDVLLELDTLKSIVYMEGEGCYNLENFEAEKLGTRHFLYTYTFTEEWLNDTFGDN